MSRNVTNQSPEQPIDITGMNLFQRMLRISTEISAINKSQTVSMGGDKSYKAVADRDILEAVKPLESKYGVFSYPRERVVLESQMYETETRYGNNPPQKKTTFMTRLMTTYRFVNVDNPNEYIETVTFAEGIDTQDKGSGKAMTYCDKYALLKAYKIITTEDADRPDSNSFGAYNNAPQYDGFYNGYDDVPPPPEPPYYGNSQNGNPQKSAGTAKNQQFNNPPPQGQNGKDGGNRWRG